ncbi:hypothetical protein ACFL15_01635, partial [Patescibacteria group bacterium]
NKIGEHINESLFPNKKVVTLVNRDLLGSKDNLEFILHIDLSRSAVSVGFLQIRKSDQRIKTFWFINPDEKNFELNTLDENISEKSKSKLFTVSRDFLKNSLAYLEEKYPRGENKNSSAIKIASISKAKGPGAIKSKSTKRKASLTTKPKNIFENVNNEVSKERYQLKNNTQIIVPEDMKEGLVEAIERYNKSQGGVVKVLSHIQSKDGNPIISLRLRSYRALFELKENGFATLVNFCNRRDLKRLNGKCL